MSIKASEIIAKARTQIGVKEYPSNSNKVLYNTEYYGKEVSGSAYPWCVVFIWWLFKELGSSSLFYNGKKTASCTTLKNGMKSQYTSGASGLRAGDLVFFNFSGGTATQHVGLCVSASFSLVSTIDGNTGTSNEANGGAVMERTRATKYVVGYIRPNYAETNPYNDPGGVVKYNILTQYVALESVKWLQWQLNQFGYKLTVDGKFGKNTLNALLDFQRKHGLVADGKCGSLTKAELLFP